MDSFTLVIFLIMIMIAINQGVTWAAAGLIIILVFSMRSKGLIILVGIALLLGYMLQATSQILWLIVAVIIVAIFLFKQGAEGPGAYSPEMLLGG